ncbi:GNAT family N-acetyltransferase [Microtetraspora sp. AC03309]|uniref:GNAT family N-acetyltransferase n=1 Tax=Microtetraspora sp. AC03309 TaxID=2779376 RepID=UPI001E4AA228|nr:GNAT family N-acetyltransferase [Microtetraspora sp. AC03309]MCC5577833.1 GNAT family N-acetyltransferase [Microtetraspora sp. AC03309]
MTVQIRPITESEWPAFATVDRESFNSPLSPEQHDRFREFLELDRSLAAFDGDLIVGATAVASLTMTVPGGPVPVAGVTAVAVLPSHRRRGILTSLMTRQLNDVHERGESVAALYASEAAIYGRFGYGRAADNLFFRIPTHRSAFVRDAPVDPSLRVRLAVPAEAARADVERVFEAVRTTRPGLYARSDARWRLDVLGDEEFQRRGAGPLRCLIVEDDSGPRGYALFRVKGGWTDHNVPDGEVLVDDLFATDPAAYALVWRSVLDRDLCVRLHAWGRPVDDPLMHLLAEPRQLNAGWLDDLWIRLVDVGRALAGRAYAAPVDVVIEVEDRLCPWNAGRYRLVASPGPVTGKASCERTGDPADLTVPVTALGAAYLGGRPLLAVGAAGLVTEHSEGALRELSTAMSWEPRPWGSLIF